MHEYCNNTGIAKNNKRTERELLVDGLRVSSSTFTYVYGGLIQISVLYKTGEAELAESRTEVR